MVWLLSALVPAALIAGYLLRAWLSTHPGHPILEEIDSFLLQSARQAKLQEASAALNRLGIASPALPPTAASVAAAPVPAPASSGK